MAPTLFATLSDRILAGNVAGSVFRVQAWVSVCCAIALAALVLLRVTESPAAQRKTLLILIGAMLTGTLIGYFGLQPLMASLKAATGPASVMTADARMQFGILHGVASVIYLLESLLGVVLVLKIR